MARSTKEKIEMSMLLAWKLDKYNHHEVYDSDSEPTTDQTRRLFKVICKQSNLSAEELTAKLINGDFSGRQIQKFICKERGCENYEKCTEV